MSKKPRENRVPIMMSDDELAAIDDWRFANRVATRSDAVRRLVQIGLRLEPQLGHMSDLIRSQLKRYAALNQIIDVLTGFTFDNGNSGSPLDREEKNSQQIILLLDWYDEAWTEATELHEEIIALSEQNDAFSGAEDFSEALRVADDVRSGAERLRSLWSDRLEHIRRLKAGGTGE